MWYHRGRPLKLPLPDRRGKGFTLFGAIGE
jgi:hypothetical protein